jgi:hypothetical protein
VVAIDSISPSAPLSVHGEGLWMIGDLARRSHERLADEE